MKKLMFVMFAVALMMSMMAVAQDTTKQDSAKQDNMTSAKTSNTAVRFQARLAMTARRS